MTRKGEKILKLSLKTRLIISYSLLAIFLVASLLFISNYMLEYHFQSYVQKKQESLNRAIADTVLDAYRDGGAPNQTFLRAFATQILSDGIILMVSDAQGNEIFCMGCVDSAGCENMLDAMRRTMQTRYPNWQGEYTERAYPMERDGAFYGTVTLGYYGPFYYGADDIAFINRLNRVLIGAALLFLLLAVVVGGFMANRISQPIKRVIDWTKEIAKNRYDERIDDTSSTVELNQLIGSVNALAASLQEQQKLKKRMARDYAHEFRTPLAALQSNMEAMIDGIFAPTPERLESCRAEILRLSRMTAQIDHLVELENSAKSLCKASFDFSALLAQIALSFEHDLHEKGIAFERSAPPCAIYADKDKISQVIVNLLSNAVKYTDDGGRIRAAVTDARDSLIFTVADTGRGIAADDLPFIFEYLYRTDHSRARDTGGSGIGLSVVKTAVDAHLGEIAVTSAPGKGSTFTVTLPKR